MKKVKLVILLFLVCFIFTGCSVKYNLTIHDDSSLDEYLESKNDINFFRQYQFFTPRQVLENYITMEKENLNTYHYQYSITDDNIVVLNNHYDHNKDYFLNNPIYQQFFSEMSYEEDSNVVTIQNVGEFIPYTEGNPSYYGIDYIDINIKLPFKVLKHNADKVDKKNNTYTWIIRKSTKEKDFILKYDQSKLATSGNQLNDNIFIIILLIIIGLALGTLLWTYIQYKKFE